MWLDDPALTTLVMERFAVWAAPRCIAYDIPPIRRTEKTKWENGARGFLTHAATETWRGYPGRRRDPGLDFPWTQFFTLLKAEIARLDGDTMALKDYEQNAVDHLLDVGVFTTYTVANPADMDEPVPLKTLAVFLSRLYKKAGHVADTGWTSIPPGTTVIFTGTIEET